MALIAMAVHDLEDNQRSELTRRTLVSIVRTVAFSRHRLIIIDNGSCDETKRIIKNFTPVEGISVITLPQNEGTANAINRAWATRKPGEHCIKMDNDVVIHSKNWIEEMEEVIKRSPSIGQVGLKRKDCWEHTEHENPELRSRLIQLPHNPGERWVVVEQSKHIIGTCVMHNAALIDKVGGLYQPGVYGYDDVLMSWRSALAGFVNVFLPHIDIDHIDPGGTAYQTWKERHAGKYQQGISDLVDDYISGAKSIYYPL